MRERESEDERSGFSRGREEGGEVKRRGKIFFTVHCI